MSVSDLNLKHVHLSRKLKRDLQAELTEASFPGAALSVVAAIVMLGLIFAELNSFLTVQAGYVLFRKFPSVPLQCLRRLDLSRFNIRD